MLESAELGQTLSKEKYDAVLPGLRVAMLEAQERLRKAGFSVVVLVNGPDGAGKSETVNALHEWFDARYLHTEAYEPPSDDERARPEYWRYWQWLPAAGRIAVFSGSWYTEPLTERVLGKLSDGELAESSARINSFERTLSDGGTLFVKLWFHISKKAQRRRLKALESDRTTRYRVTKQDWKNHERYDRIAEVSEQLLSETSTADAPWHVIDGEDARHRNVTAARTILEALEARLKQTPRSSPPPVRLPPIDDPDTVLDRLDLTKALDKRAYEGAVAELQARLGKVTRKLRKRGQSAILVFEGADAAGKGGAIRRITWALDARSYRVIPISAPTEEERAHHYLWRFWRWLPRRGRLTIFDRSWYGRVLVERVEGYAREPEWQRAYQEINEFERELVRGGGVLIKFWLHISLEEQARRFDARANDPTKRHKITPEDYRNREQANQYEAAAAEMLARCSPPTAPFTLVEANDKHFARVKVLQTVCERLEAALER